MVCGTAPQEEKEPIPKGYENSYERKADENIMNKWLGQGRVVKDPEIRYGKGDNPIKIASYTLAVSRGKKKEGFPDVDFIDCVAYGFYAEFAEKFMKKGGQFIVIGKLQKRSWEGQDGKKHYATEIVVEECYFCGSKKDSSSDQAQGGQNGFYPMSDDEIDDDLPY